ncbi:MAG: diaminopimelate epimerase [Planctomycetota bacterium]
MPFVKMHGLGNDYVYVDGFTHDVPDPPALARAVADRHFGVGGDGLILTLPPEDGVEADARMRMFNADGSEAEMCGNGIRCVCKMVHDHRLGTRPDAKPMRIQTGNGVLSLDYTLDADGRVDAVAVEMGEPTLHLPAIPVDESKLDARLDAAVFVGMGNPHAVLYVDDPDAELVDPERGAELEHHPAFPNRMNVHFVRLRKTQDNGTADEVDVYHWERGSGATLACGTGACAVCVAGVLSGRTGRRLTAHLPGGPLDLEWRESDNQVVMTGPAVEVFAGVWPG